MALTKPSTIRFGTRSSLLIEIRHVVVHWFTRRVKEAIHIRFYPNNINRNNGIEIPEAWMRAHDQKNTTTGKRYNNGPLREQLLVRTMEQWEDRNAPITADFCDINDSVQSVDLIAWRRLAVSSRNVAIYISSVYIVRLTIIHCIMFIIAL